MRRTWRTYLVRPPQVITRYFLTDAGYEAWKDTLPVRDQIDADLYAHVGHFRWEHLPNRCTACGLNEAMWQTLTRQSRILVCRHGSRECEECS